MRQPADPPARHGPWLGEGVEHDQRIVRPGLFQERGRDRTRIDQARIDLVGHDPHAALLGEVEQRALLVRAHRPARGVSRRIDEDRARAVVDRVEHLLQVERPAAVRLAVERHILRLAPDQPGRRGDVRPDRRDDDDIVAGIEQKLARQQDRLHAARRDRQPVDGAFDAVEALGIGRECRAQLGDAALPSIERLAGLQALGCRVAHEVGRHEVAFAEPQRHHLGIAEHAHRHFGDRRFGQATGDRPAQRRGQAWQVETGSTLHASDLAHRRRFRQPATCRQLLTVRPSLPYR